MLQRVPFRQTNMPVSALTGPFQSIVKPAGKAVISRRFSDLASIYDDAVNLCLIERPRPVRIEQFVYNALQNASNIEISQPVEPELFDFTGLWPQASHIEGYQDWVEDVALLSEAFCELLGCQQTGLRLRTLKTPMCPRFHVDRVPARMICSYGGIGTEWLPEYALDRRKLGMNSRSQPDTVSGLIVDDTAIRQMPAYAVGLMKGESWEGNEGFGLVHRSPTPTAVQPRRLLLTLDML
jgi:hypothetical protein